MRVFLLSAFVVLAISCQASPYSTGVYNHSSSKIGMSYEVKSQIYNYPSKNQTKSQSFYGNKQKLYKGTKKENPYSRILGY